MRDADAMQSALTAIQEEAEKLLQQTLSVEVQDVIERIISIARHAFDVRTAAEQLSSRT